MSKITFLGVLILLLFPISGLRSQDTDPSTSNTEDQNFIFNNRERDSLQLWFYDRATVMGLKDEKRDEFYNIVLYYSYKMRGLEKKEKGNSPEQVREKFEQLLTKQNEEVRAILDDKQYTYYLDTYDKLLKSVAQRKGWE